MAERAAETGSRGSRAAGPGRHTQAHYRALFEPRGRRRRRCVHPPGQVRVREPAQHPGHGLLGQGVRHQPRRRHRARYRLPHLGRRSARGRGRPDLRVHSQGSEHRTADRGGCQGSPGGLPDHCRLRGVGRRGPPRRSRARGPLRGARHPAGRPQRTGRGVHPGASVRPDRRAYPPAGAIGVASQSGNFVSSFLNWSCATGVGISRAVSAGNAAATTVADLLEFYADDPATTVALAYMEGIDDGRSVAEALGRVAARCRWWSSRVDRPPAGPGPRPATPDRWPPTTAPSTACAARRA